MEEEVKPYERDYHDPNGYKIRCGYQYVVYRNEYNGKVFYKFPIVKTNMDGEKVMVYKQVRFANKEKDTDIPDKSIIRPITLFEDFYVREKDPYNPVFLVVLTDWEIIKDEEQLRKEAINDYNVTLEMDDVPF